MTTETGTGTGTSNGRLRAVVADDSVLLRDGVVRLLGDADIDVVAAVGDGGALVDAVIEHEPDLALVDVRYVGTDVPLTLRDVADSDGTGASFILGR